MTKSASSLALVAGLTFLATAPGMAAKVTIFKPNAGQENCEDYNKGTSQVRDAIYNYIKGFVTGAAIFFRR
jgi:hypothetical protein